MITIFTDGGCDINRIGAQNKGAYSYVIINDAGVKISESVKTENNTTNNRMEVMAVIDALEKIKHYDDEVTIFSDSTYVVDTFVKKRYLKWISNNWKLGKIPPSKDVPNKDLWLKLLPLVKNNMTFKWVKAHTTTNTWNIYVDELCNNQIYKKHYTIK